MGWWPCGGCGSCANCTGGATIDVEFANTANGTFCTNCSDLDGTYTFTLVDAADCVFSPIPASNVCWWQFIGGPGLISAGFGCGISVTEYQLAFSVNWSTNTVTLHARVLPTTASDQVYPMTSAAITTWITDGDCSASLALPVSAYPVFDQGGGTFPAFCDLTTITFN